MSFNWNEYRLNRLRSAVRAYNSTITKRINDLSNVGLTSDAEMLKKLQPKKTIESVQKRINNVNDFRRIVGYSNDRRMNRPSELDRILKSVNPHALDLVPSNNPRGGLDTLYNNLNNKQYDEDQEDYAKQQRDDFGKPLYKGDDKTTPLEDMTPQEKANAIDNTDMTLSDEGERDTSVEDLEPEVYNGWDAEDKQNYASSVTLTSKFDEYMAELTSTEWHHRFREGYLAFVDALNWLAENRPRIVNKIFNAGYDWADPPYLYESGGPYDQIPIDYRYSRAFEKWLEIYANEQDYS